MWLLWLVDKIYALHVDLRMDTFSSTELWTEMPSSAPEFQSVYNILISRKGDAEATLPTEMNAADDAVLLLTAILSDLLFIQRSLGRIINLANDSAVIRDPDKPHPPLSPRSELRRMHNTLSTALQRWGERFATQAPSEVLAFFHYCRLHLLYPRLLELPRIAGYGPLSKAQISQHNPPAVPASATSTAWLILDKATARTRSDATLCPIWLPIAVFHAGLVVWAGRHLSGGSGSNEGVQGSAMMLVPFRIELETMNWPCCRDMAATLDRLVQGSIMDRRK